MPALASGAAAEWEMSMKVNGVTGSAVGPSATKATRPRSISRWVQAGTVRPMRAVSEADGVMLQKYGRLKAQDATTIGRGPLAGHCKAEPPVECRLRQKVAAPPPSKGNDYDPHHRS
jgi:hypothetical protein